MLKVWAPHWGVCEYQNKDRHKDCEAKTDDEGVWHPFDEPCQVTVHE
ncbi:hypothetical protein GCM10011359_31150 [Nesterenkonia alkaliphila]|nr:hypothetical protein GCM10011359_31150 [Nesterenkonia alkaliphila]